MIDKLITEIQKLQEAEEILSELWAVIGPYGDRSGYGNKDIIFSEDLMGKMRKHFNFDDGE